MEAKFYRSPQWVKRRISNFVNYYKIRSLSSKGKTPSKGPPIVIGLLSSPTGLGEGARLIYSGLLETEFKPSYIDFTSTFLPDLAGSVCINESSEISQDGPVIIHLNPMEALVVLATLGPDFFRNRKIIGIWAWEQTILPKNWVRMQGYFDEVWAISEYMYKMLRKQLSIPVFYTGYPAALLARPKIKQLSNTGQEDFVVFSSFDPRSDLMRKNPHASVEAFQLAFPKEQKQRVSMLLKITKSYFDLPENWVSDSRIKVVNEILDEDALCKVISSASCVISLHRSEGYGLQIAKALSLGVPSIFTNFSATAEFSDCPGSYPVGYRIKEGGFGLETYNANFGKWVDPDIERAAMYLKKVRLLTLNQRLKMREDGIRWWIKNHSAEEFVNRLPLDTKSLFKSN